MHAIEILQLKRLKFELASQIVLDEINPELLSKLICPNCNSQGVPTLQSSQGIHVGYCVHCNCQFEAIPTDQICHCVFPGKGKQCNGCPNFERIMELINAQLTDPKALGSEDLLLLNRGGKCLKPE